MASEEDLRVAREVIDKSRVTIDDVWTNDEDELQRDIVTALSKARAEQQEAIKTLLGRLPENSDVADCVAAIDGDTSLIDDWNSENKDQG